MTRFVTLAAAALAATLAVSGASAGSNFLGDRGYDDLQYLRDLNAGKEPSQGTLISTRNEGAVTGASAKTDNGNPYFRTNKNMESGRN
ncbi:hypothetical protein [Thalassococcus sp. S3]|uniref:hypothetical protein n=1 Tax=Thalassococcus sp. S3 TaxID=2017482 RepID=UPI0010248BD6|nr:hypothetical protein [Thalassococcus sp. S3]QBF30764.1 hypothetical protein CFI11_05970 [Thalassococcus sp. S3]